MRIEMNHIALPIHEKVICVSSVTSSRRTTRRLRVRFAGVTWEGSQWTRAGFSVLRGDKLVDSNALSVKDFKSYCGSFVALRGATVVCFRALSANTSKSNCGGFAVRRGATTIDAGL